MKKSVFAFLAFATCVVIVSCNEHTAGPSDKAKKNLETNRAILKMFESGDFSKTGDYIAADAVDHSGPQGEVKGLDSIKAMFQMFSSTMSDTKAEVVKELADDEYSMVWIRQTWTQAKDDAMMGMKAGQQGDMQTIELCKHGADGKITDHWGFMSMADMQKMMPQMPKDTTGNK